MKSIKTFLKKLQKIIKTKRMTPVLIAALLCGVMLCLPYANFINARLNDAKLPAGGDPVRNSADVFNERIPVTATERAFAQLSYYDNYERQRSEAAFIADPTQGYEAFCGQPYTPPQNGRLFGKRVLILGDSTAANVIEQTGEAFLIEQTTGAAVYNYAIGGTCASTFDDGGRSDFYGEFSDFPVVAAAIATKDFSMMPKNSVASNILSQLDFTQFDCIILQYGTNDSLLGVEVGNADDPFKNVKSFAGGLTYGIDLLKKAAPQAEILVVTPYYINFGTTAKSAEKAVYVNTAIAVADRLSADSLDMFHLMPINEDNNEQFISDGVHLNEQGRAMFAALISDKLMDMLD